MTQKLEKLKTNMSVILDLGQNWHKQILLRKEILMQKLMKLKSILKKLQTFDSGYFKSKNYFGEDGAQKYLVFQPIFIYFKISTINNNTNYVLLRKSKGSSDETIKPPTTSDNSLTPTLSYNLARKIRVKFSGSCLKQDKVNFIMEE